LYTLLMGSLIALSLTRPAVAVGAILSMFAIEQWAQANNALFTRYAWLTNVLVGLMACFAVAMKILRNERVVTPLPKQFWAPVAVLAWWMIARLWTIAPDDAAAINWRSAPYWIVSFVMLTLLVSNFRDMRSALYVLITIGACLLPVFAMSYTGTEREIQFERSGAAVGQLDLKGGNPLAIATFAGTVSIAAILMNFRGMARFWTVLRWAVVAVGIIVSIRSGSRGQLFALIVVVLAFLPLSRRINNLAGFAGLVMGVLIFGVLLSAVYGQFATDRRWEPTQWFDAYTQGRVNTSVILLNEWFDAGPVAWLLGLGAAASYQVTGLWFYPHLVMAEVLGELGLIGFVILWLVPIFGFAAVKQAWPYVKDHPEMRGIIATVAAMFLFDIVLSFKQGSVVGYPICYAMCGILGRLAWTLRYEHQQYQAEFDQADDDSRYLEYAIDRDPVDEELAGVQR
jgi:hypothetical protein